MNLVSILLISNPWRGLRDTVGANSMNCPVQPLASYNEILSFEVKLWLMPNSIFVVIRHLLSPLSSDIFLQWMWVLKIELLIWNMQWSIFLLGHGIIEYVLVAWLVFYISRHRDDDILDVKVDNWTLYMDFIAFKLGFFA
jgi:hypothetical protein